MPEASEDYTNGKATLRDVYSLVNATRQEVARSIGELASKFDAFVTSNEHRLTILETHHGVQARQLAELVSRVDRHGEDLGKLKDQQRTDEAATNALSSARSSRWRSANAVIIAACTLALAAGTFLAIFLH